MYKLAVGVIAATLTIAACGGGSSKPKSSAGDATTTTSGDNNPTTTAAGGGGGGDFSALVTKAKSANIKVTYTIDGGQSLTIAQDGTGKTALIDDNSITIADGTKTISCDGRTSSATCTDLGVAGAGSVAALSFFTATYAGLASLNSTAFGGHTSSEKIAGRDATCISYKTSDLAGGALPVTVPGNPGVIACVDATTGVLLKYSTTANDKTTDMYLATAAGESSPSDFEPPSTPQTLPSIPGGLPTIPGS
jgi:hypothetical protein